MSLIRVAGVKLLAMKRWAARTFLVPTTTTILAGHLKPMTDWTEASSTGRADPGAPGRVTLAELRPAEIINVAAMPRVLRRVMGFAWRYPVHLSVAGLP